MAEDKQKPERPEEELRQESAEEWKKYVREEVNAYLDAFLDLASEGNIGVKYAFADKSVYEDGTVEPDTKEAQGVQMLLNFKFESPLYFTDEDGFVDSK